MVAARNDPEMFRRWHRVTLALLMAVGPTIADETQGQADEGWWRDLLPEATQLMAHRQDVLKLTRFAVQVEPSVNTEDMSASARRAPRNRRRPKILNSSANFVQGEL